MGVGETLRDRLARTLGDPTLVLGYTLPGENGYADEAGRPIKLPAFDAIGRDLAQLYAALETRDLAAGSPAARRLFAG